MERYRAVSPRSTRFRWHMPAWLAGLLWFVICGLGVVGILRIVSWDSNWLLALINSVSAVVYLPAWPIALIALLSRRLILAAVALVICALQILLMAPEFTATQPLPRWTAHAPSILLLDGNVYNENPTMAGYIVQIRNLHPDLVTMEEAVPSDVKQIRKSGALSELPHQYEVSAYDPFAFFIASRYPLVGSHVIRLFGRALVVETTIDLPSGPQPLWVVHTIAPLSTSFDQWRTQLATISRLVREHGTEHLLVVGDFNATWGNRGFRTILNTGLVDGAAARGHALEMTWSQMMPPLPPFARIDHVLTGPGVEVTQYSTLDGPGSDHRDLVATIAVRPSRGRRQ